MYRELRRMFVMAGHLEKESVASTGVIQGCPLCAFAEPPDIHLGRICENRDHNSDAESLRRRRWSSQ